MAVAPKTVDAYRTDPEKVTFINKLAAAFCLSSFVIIWLSSIASPFLLVWCYWKQYYIAAAILTAVTSVAYIPWQRGHFAHCIQRVYNHYPPFFHKSASIEFEGTLPCAEKDNQTFYAVHPHGAFCIGWSMLFALPAMDHVRFCFAPALYASPLFRLFSRLVGNPGSAAKFAMERYMRHGEHIALPPGGFEEATLTCPTQDRVFVKKRTGFVRLCLKHGLELRPVYVFGENKLYWNIQGMFKYRLALNRYGLPTILVWGHPLFPLICKSNVEVHVVVGAPLKLPKIENPTKDDVALWHGKYIVELTKLFEEHKEKAYGPEEGKVAKLEVW